MKHKKGLIVFTALFSVVVFLGIFLMMWFWGDEYPDFDSVSFREEIAIPGLKDGACPQGLAIAKGNTYSKDGEIVYKKDSEGKPDESQPVTEDYYFVSAYFKEGPSRIYVTGKNSGYLGYVSLTYGGKPFRGHVGGVATDGVRWLWVGSESTVYCIKRLDTKKTIVDELILSCRENGELALDSETAASFKVNGSASFVSYYKASSSTSSSTERLYVGEFYRAGNYETPESHHITLPDGTVNRAFMYEYNVYSYDSTTNPYGLYMISSDEKLDKQVPRVQRIYSIPDRIQGVARVSGSNDDNKGDVLILSQSYGLANSEIMMYNFKTIEESGNHQMYTTLVNSDGFEYSDVTYGGVRSYYDTSVYVYYVFGKDNVQTLDSTGAKMYPSFIRSYSLPSMSEGLAVGSDDRVNILFESSASKYKMFVRQPLDKIYSFRPTHVR